MGRFRFVVLIDRYPSAVEVGRLQTAGAHELHFVESSGFRLVRVVKAGESVQSAIVEFIRDVDRAGFSVTRVTDLGEVLDDPADQAGIDSQASADGVLVERLRAVLQERASFEQVKGVIAEQTGLSVEQAAGLLRDHSHADRDRIVLDAENLIKGIVSFRHRTDR